MQVLTIRKSDMVLDKDLARDILIRINDDQECDGTWEFYFDTPEEMGISGRSLEEVSYHLTLLIEAGYVDGAVLASNTLVIRRLTWNGHEFLDSLRDPNIWAKTKERTKGLTSVALAVLGEIGKAEIRKQLGLP